MTASLLFDFLWRLVFFYFAVGIGEYVAHRWVMHKRWSGWMSYNHHDQGHHEQQLDHPVIVHVDLPIWIHLIVCSPLIAFQIYAGRWIGLAALICVLCWHSYVWSKMHRQMHKIENNWTRKLPSYKAFEKHHQGHHQDKRTNFSVLYLRPFPWIDWIFRTWRINNDTR